MLLVAVLNERARTHQDEPAVSRGVLTDWIQPLHLIHACYTNLREPP